MFMAGRARRYLWVLGAALLAAVVVAALHMSEGEEFVRLASRSRPWWLVVALVLQAGTYVAQGAIFRDFGRATSRRIPASAAFELSLAKLFADQAVPTAGLSGNVIVAGGLERLALPAPAVKAAVLVNVAAYNFAYVAALCAALAVLVQMGAAGPTLLLVAILFLMFGTALAVAAVLSPGWTRLDRIATSLRPRPLRALAAYVRAADASLARRPRLVLDAATQQLVIVLLDAATMWVLVKSLGTTASPEGVFASFMAASLFRTMGVIPGGLGVFEATSVVALRTAGVAVPVGLSATLLFRGLSFWIPMLPGYWCSRRIMTGGWPRGGRKAVRAAVDEYWTIASGALLARLGSTPDGLSSAEGASRLERYGPNTLRASVSLSRLRTLGDQLRSPLLLLLLAAALASIASGQWLDAAIVLVIVVATVGIGYSREYNAQAAALALRARIRTSTVALRDGRCDRIPVEAIVPGDVVQLSAGALVPGDGVVLDANDFFVSEAALTGESFPVEKHAGVSPPGAGLAARPNAVFFGTNVRSGTARCVIVATGAATAFGAIAGHLAERRPETEFDRDLRRFGHLLTIAMLVMVLLVFAVQVIFGRPPIETLLFAIALAVGLSPELLPAILGVNLARGAQMMAKRGVLVRRLNAIENLGSIDVLCTDKTGTLTEGVVRLEGAYDVCGAASPAVLRLAAINAGLQTGLPSPLDDAILAAIGSGAAGAEKLGEIPFDFIRKRVTVVAESGGSVRLITKGAFAAVLQACTHTIDHHVLNDAVRSELERRHLQWSRDGTRVLAVAVRDIERRDTYVRGDERDLELAGFLTFLDRPKHDAAEAIGALGRLGVGIKIITGDNRFVTQHVARLVGLRADRLLTGRHLDELQDEALWREADRTDLFAEVDPNQKERVILALKKTGHVVGFLGDGVNDAPAMHAADTSLSVDQAVDVARDAADFVLLERDLDVIRGGIEEGRRTFANTLKYVLITTSANLGNMVSMAAASLVLPFLPLTAGQILLNNFLSDIPAVGVADDSVDPELVEQPRRWDIRFVGRFMMEFGILSSLFDLVTFAALIGLFHAAVETFRTGWFVESLLTELVVALVVRTRRPFYRSRPGALLFWTTVPMIGLAFAIAFLPFAGIFGFVALPGSLLAAISLVTIVYVASAELLKIRFYRSRVASPAPGLVGPGTEARQP
jgi:P-type Mg2+ transporter